MMGATGRKVSQRALHDHFLRIAPFPPVAQKTAHAGDYDTALDEEARRYLIAVFEPEIRELERLLGWDCSDWLR